MPRVTLFVLLSLIVSNLKAQKTWKERLNPDSLVNGHVNLIPIPIFQTTPETGIRIGLSMDYFFNASGSDTSTTTRDSYAWAQVSYSTKRQLLFEPAWQIYTNKETWYLKGRTGYTDFSEKVWNIGPNLLPYDQYSDLLYKRTYFQGIFAKRIGQLFIGPQIKYSNTYQLTDSPAESLLPFLLPTTASGLGLTVILDKRNNPFSPYKGHYLELSSIHYRQDIGSSNRFDEYLLDARYYFTLQSKHTFAFQALYNGMNGDVPFREIPRLGGSNLLRGLTEGRQRDNQFAAAQTEYRYTINRFFKAAAFLSLGAVSPTLASFQWSQVQQTGGVGLRILVNEKKQLYSRFDMAISKTDPIAFYFKLMDAF